MPGAVVEKPATGKFPQVGNSLPQTIAVKIGVKQYRVNMGRHNHVGVCAKPLVFVTKIQTVGHNSTCSFRNKNRKPFDDGKRNEIHGTIFVKTKSFHG